MTSSARGALCVMAWACLAGCASGGPSGSPDSDAKTVDLRRKLSDLNIVDCIVEGRTFGIGSNFTYLEPPRMARLSEFECASLGGTFVLYDPTAPDEVIARWLPFAEKGNAVAQHRLGLLYEGVMGAEPNYEKAAYWYGEAVKSGHRESMYALSILYEKGLGVERDMLKSLNLYRQASGLEKDSLMLSSEAYRQIDAAKAGLSQEIEKLAAQRDALQDQARRLEKEAARENTARVRALEELASSLTKEVEQKETNLASLPTYRLLTRTKVGTVTKFDFPPLPARTLRKRGMGKFYALIIGNNNYDRLPVLKTPHNDAKRIAEILSSRYGFSTQVLLDANEEEIKRAIDNLDETVGADDNLLIYFAGHGQIRKAAERSRLRGYWLPTNADAEQDINWVDNWWITDHLDAAKAKRALVIADSCYGGIFSTDLPIGPVTQLPPLAAGDFDKKLARRSRFVLASGGKAPVIDAAEPSADHSVFAGALIRILEENQGAMSIVELYGRVFDRMYDQLTALGLSQEPELRVIRAAGHQGEGDFFFVAN